MNEPTNFVQKRVRMRKEYIKKYLRNLVHSVSVGKQLGL